MCKAIKNYFEERRARKEVLTTFDDMEIDSMVKIQGTNFDRKRKYKIEFFADMKSEFERGFDINDIAKRYNMNPITVRYNVDSQFRALYNARRAKGTHPIGSMDFENRVAYKRELIKTKQIKCAGLV